MSERYAKCRSCNGHGFVYKKDLILLRSEKKECGACGGTGMSGDGIAYENKELRAQHEADFYN